MTGNAPTAYSTRNDGQITLMHYPAVGSVPPSAPPLPPLGAGKAGRPNYAMEPFFVALAPSTVAAPQSPVAAAVTRPVATPQSSVAAVLTRPVPYAPAWAIAPQRLPVASQPPLPSAAPATGDTGRRVAAKVLGGLGGLVLLGASAVTGAAMIMRNGHLAYEGATSAAACMQAFGCNGNAYDANTGHCSPYPFVPGSFVSGGVEVPYARSGLQPRAPHEDACLQSLHVGDLLRDGAIAAGALGGALGLALIAAAVRVAPRARPQAGV